MPSARQSTLKMPSSSRSSLSHSMTVRPSMAAFSIGTSSHSGPWVITMPPTCCPRCRGKPTSSPTSRDQPRRPETNRDRCPPRDSAPASSLQVMPFQALGQGIDPIERQAQRLAHVAHGRARAIGDHFGRHAGPFAAVLVVQVLQHFLAPLVLEVDVDVGGFVPLAAEEPFEQHVQPVGIDGRHAQAITDRRVGRAAAPLAQNASLAGEPHQVVHGEKIGLVAQVGDQRQLVLDQRANLVGNALRITLRPRRPRSAASDIPAASAPAEPAPRDTRSATRRARRSSARQFPACGPRPPAPRQTARPFPRAISSNARRWETAARRPRPRSAQANRRQRVLQRQPRAGSDSARRRPPPAATARAAKAATSRPSAASSSGPLASSATR